MGVRLNSSLLFDLNHVVVSSFGWGRFGFNASYGMIQSHALMA